MWEGKAKRTRVGCSPCLDSLMRQTLAHGTHIASLEATRNSKTVSWSQFEQHLPALACHLPSPRRQRIGCCCTEPRLRSPYPQSAGPGARMARIGQKNATSQGSQKSSARPTARCWLHTLEPLQKLRETKTARASISCGGSDPLCGHAWCESAGKQGNKLLPVKLSCVIGLPKRFFSCCASTCRTRASRRALPLQSGEEQMYPSPRTLRPQNSTDLRETTPGSAFGHRTLGRGATGFGLGALCKSIAHRPIRVECSMWIQEFSNINCDLPLSTSRHSLTRPL